jgi:23S rRNA (cytidine1920-2'-O)/16S rRNA (cytidine1409-2'-O)-methyltransferase
LRNIKNNMARLDIELTVRGICKSRAQAQLSIKESNVLLNGNICLKPNKEIKETDTLSLVQIPKYVSRGGDKLAAALLTFGVNGLEGKTALDIGSSTGGFTDCLLQNKVSKVYAVDVGTAQLDSLLRNDARVVVLEKTDIRSLKTLPERVGIIVIDVSFISLDYIIPSLGHFIVPRGDVVALIKPQFEVGRGKVNRQGLVTDQSLYKEVVEKVEKSFGQQGFEVVDTITSPIIGGTGNTEFLIHAVKK